MQLAEPWLGPAECRVLGSGQHFGTSSLGSVPGDPSVAGSGPSQSLRTAPDVGTGDSSMGREEDPCDPQGDGSVRGSDESYGSGNTT